MSRTEEGSGFKFMYSMVSRGRVILAEHAEFTGNFAATAAHCLEGLPSPSSPNNNTKKFTYTRDRHTFHFLVDDNGYSYCVVAVESVGVQLSTAFLERIKADFRRRYGSGKADMAAAGSLSKEFGPIIKQHMKHVIDHADEIDKLIKVKAQVSQVKSAMLDNIDKAVDRGTKLTILEEKSEDLRNEAQIYKTQGTQLKRKMWYQNIKIKLAVIVILLILALIIWVSICHGFNCNK